MNCRERSRNFRHHRHGGRGYVGGQSAAVAIATSSSSPTEPWHCSQSLADDYFFLATFRLVVLAAVFLAAGFVFALDFFAMLPS
jgi:hypothetical protein